MRFLDLFRVPTNLDVDGRHGDTPYRASCPEGDWVSDRWVATARTAREQQTRHWAREHYRYDQEGWGAGPSGGGLLRADTTDDDPGENKGWFW